MRYLLATLALYSSTVATQPRTDETVLTVLLKVDSVPAPVLRAMRREAESEVASSGVKLNWGSSQDLQGTGINGQIAIIELRGQCGPGAPARAVPPPVGEGSEALGQTHMVNGKVLPIADVLCDAVHQLVDRDLRTAPAGAREELLGRALGRVLAHELYHIILRTTDHAHGGLRRSALTSAELLAPHNAFGEPDEHRITDSASTDSGGR
jgi:hypothetical protein